MPDILKLILVIVLIFLVLKVTFKILKLILVCILVFIILKMIGVI